MSSCLVVYNFRHSAVGSDQYGILQSDTDTDIKEQENYDI